MTQTQRHRRSNRPSQSALLDSGVPPEAAAALRRLEARDGRIYPHEVVAAARDPNSPLHAFFEWDNDVAASRWRLQQAALLIRRVKHTIFALDIPITIPRYLKDPTIVAVPEAPIRPYRNIDNVKTERDTARAILIDEMKRVALAVRRAKNLAVALGFEEDIDAIQILAEGVIGSVGELNENSTTLGAS
jgi:hypothetical protein